MEIALDVHGEINVSLKSKLKQSKLSRCCQVTVIKLISLILTNVCANPFSFYILFLVFLRFLLDDFSFSPISLYSRAVETHLKKSRIFRFFKKPKKPEKLGF